MTGRLEGHPLIRADADVREPKTAGRAWAIPVADDPSTTAVSGARASVTEPSLRST